jgi:hypothetical protein
LAIFYASVFANSVVSLQGCKSKELKRIVLFFVEKGSNSLDEK